MFYYTCTLIIVLCIWTTWASPQQTAYTNTTSALNAVITPSPSPASTCAANCTYYPVLVTYNEWIPGYSKVTVATVILVINDSTNATSTTTQYVESLLVNGTAPTNIRRTNTNSAGTITSVVTGYRNSTTTIAYPTPYSDYVYSYRWSGILPSKTSNQAICITASPTTLTEAFGPSHPPLPTTVTYPDDDDTQSKLGEGYILMSANAFLSPTFITAAFADQLANLVFQDCDAALGPAPAVAAFSVSYLTETSISHVRGDTPSPSEAPVQETPVQETPMQETPVQETPPSAPSNSASISVPEQETIGAGYISSTLGPIIPTPSASATKPGTTNRPLSPQAATENTPMNSAAVTVTPLNTVPNGPLPSLSIGSVVLPFSIVEVSTQISSTATMMPAIVIGTSTAVFGQSLFVGSIPIIVATAGGQTEIVVNGRTTTLVNPTIAATPTSASPSLPIITSHTITQDGQSQDVIGSQTLAPGGAITEGSKPSTTVIAPQTSNSQVQLGAGSSTFIVLDTSSSPSVLTFGGQPFTVDSSSNLVFGTQTLIPGGFINVSNTPISLAFSGGVVIVGSSTQTLGARPTTEVARPLLTLGGSTYTANSASAFVIGTESLLPGGAITILGTPISLPATASYVVQGTSTIPLISAPTSVSDASVPDALIFGGQTYIGNSASDFVIAGQTLTPGGVITVSGTPISLAATPADVAVGTSTEGLGGLIISGIGGPNASVMPFEGGAPRVMDNGWAGRFIGSIILGSLWVYMSG